MKRKGRILLVIVHILHQIFNTNEKQVYLENHAYWKLKSIIQYLSHITAGPIQCAVTLFNSVNIDRKVADLFQGYIATNKIWTKPTCSRTLGKLMNMFE